MKPGAWDKYKEISKKVAAQIESIAANEDLEDETVMDKIDKMKTKIKFAAFGKTKPCTERTRNKIHAAAKGTDTE